MRQATPTAPGPTKELPLLGAPPGRHGTFGGAFGAKGFRPFFLLAGAFAMAVVPLWLLALTGTLRPDAYFDGTMWHAHEMVFGFTGAVIAGFLLTAAGNWTGRETLTGAPLLGVAALWLVARVAVLVPGLPRELVAGIDLAFLPAVAAAIGRPIVAQGNKRNYGMVGVLLALAAANGVMHLEVFGAIPYGGRRGVLVGVDLVVLLIALMAGRIFPMFTRNGTGAPGIVSHPRVDAATLGALALLTVLDAAQANATLLAIVSAVAAVLAVARAVHWGTRHVGRAPLLWILHLGYAWIPLGLALRVVAHVVPTVPASLATHALTAGAIGAVTLGMMARVALGHTGRKLTAAPAVVAAFGLVTAAALVRVVVPLLDLGHYRGALFVAGGLWTAAFGLFVVAHLTILLRPRIDGKPG